MLHLTPSAKSHLVRLRRERGLEDGHVVRFVDNAGKVSLTFAPAAQATDREVSATEIRVVLAPEVVERLDGAVIDARQEDGKDVLVIQRATRAPAS
jgi:Fe-S cluster assembly iron-binding protein IscA